ncbi:MAG: MFS transporter [Terrimicrobiaceae bacterium]
MSHSPRPNAVLLACLCGLGGFGTLALETLWIREITVRSGSTVVAASLVVSVFFLAAAAGNLVGARLVTRSKNPLAAYGVLEMLSAGLAIALFFLAKGLWRVLPPEWWVSHGGWGMAVLLVAPPSFFAGVSFPMLGQFFVTAPEQRTAAGGILYGGNLLGAGVGVLAGAVILPWYLGIAAAFVTAGLAQAVGGLIAWQLSRRPKPENPRNSRRASTIKSARSPQSPARLHDPGGSCKRAEVGGYFSSGTGFCGFPMVGSVVIFAGCGFLALAVQGLLLLWVKQMMQGSVYAVSGVLAAFILGLGGGALLASALRRRGVSPLRALPTFALICALGLMFFPLAGRWFTGLEALSMGTHPMEMMLRTTGWSLLVLGPFTVLLGVIFPLTWEILAGESGHQGQSLGRIIAANKLGAALGMWAGIFVVVPGWGLQKATILLGVGYAVFAGAFLWLSWKAGSRSPGAMRIMGREAASHGVSHQRGAFRPWRFGFSVAGCLVVMGVGVFQLTRPHVPMGLRESEREIAAYSGAYGPVSVIENDATASRSILLNTQQRLNGTGRALSTQHHQAWLPLLLAKPAPRVAAIGMASGITSSAILDFPVSEVTAIELVPEVVQAAKDHFRPWNDRIFSDPRVRVVVGDGRAVLRTLTSPMDVMICDLLFPEEDGSANLYSRDFLIEARQSLAPGGLFCLWLPAYQLQPQTAGLILRTFADVFPNAIVLRANFDPIQPVIGLLGSKSAIPIGREFLAERLATPEVRALTAQSPFFPSPDHAWLAIVGDLHAANPGFAEYPPTTDNHPLMTWLGPADLDDRRLVGMPFAKWIGQRFDHPQFPSANLGETPPTEILPSLRAANFYFIAAVADSVIPSDTRPDDVRISQFLRWLGRAREANPGVALPADALGR